MDSVDKEQLALVLESPDLVETKSVWLVWTGIEAGYSGDYGYSDTVESIWATEELALKHARHLMDYWKGYGPQRLDTGTEEKRRFWVNQNHQFISVSEHDLNPGS